MKKKIFIVILLLISIIATSSALRAEEERFMIYIINETQTQADTPKALLLRSHSSPFEHHTVIKIDTKTGQTWILCEIGLEHDEPTKDGKRVLSKFMDWCQIMGLPKK